MSIGRSLQGCNARLIGACEEGRLVLADIGSPPVRFNSGVTEATSNTFRAFPGGFMLAHHGVGKALAFCVGPNVKF